MNEMKNKINTQEDTAMNESINTNNTQEDATMNDIEEYNDYYEDEIEIDEYNYDEDEEEYDFCDEDYFDHDDINYDRMSDNELQNYMMFGDLPDDYEPSTYGYCHNSSRYDRTEADEKYTYNSEDEYNRMSSIDFKDLIESDCDDDDWAF